MVPLSNYNEYETSIEKIVHGESRVLTEEVVTRLVPTSGSTSGCKLIPWTASLQREFNRAIGAWVSEMFRLSPELKGGPAYWSVSPAVPPSDSSGSEVPIGFDDDTDYLGGLAGRVIAKVMAVPAEVRHLNDTANFRYFVLLHLIAARELRLISVWHPTFLTLLLDDMGSHWEAIIQTLRSGVICPPNSLSSAQQSMFQHGVRAMPGRANEIDKIGPMHPDQIWPKLKLLSAWGDPSTNDVRNLIRRFPNVRYQAKGLLATEAFVSIPFAEMQPLAITSHFFEFLDHKGNLHLAHELESGNQYQVVVTTSGGLYRYQLGDLVEVTGFLDRTPCLRFMGRSGDVSDLRGEKLDPQFVAGIIDRLIKPYADAVRFRLLVGDPDSAGYTLVLVADSLSDLESLAINFETALCENPHYRLCRFLGQLRAVEVLLAAQDSIDRYFDRKTSTGRSLGNLKPSVIDTTPNILSCFSA